MARLKDFYPWVLPFAHGIPDPTADQYIRDACIEFAESTGILITTDTQDAVEDQAAYSLSPPAQSELVTVLGVYYGPSQLASVASDNVNHGAAMRAALDMSVEPTKGIPLGYYQTSPSDTDIYLWPVPSETVAANVAIRACWKPLRNATIVDDKLFQDYAPDIANGALSKLLLIPGQPFSNPQLATERRIMFRSAIQNARSSGRKGNVRSSLRVSPRSFV